MSERGRVGAAPLLVVGTAAVGVLVLLGGIFMTMSPGGGSFTGPLGLLVALAGALLIVAAVGRFEGWTWWSGVAGLILGSLAAILRGGVFVLSGVVTLLLVAYGVARRRGWLTPRQV